MSAFWSALAALSAGSFMLLAISLWRARALNISTLLVSAGTPALAMGLFVALGGPPPTVDDREMTESLTDEVHRNPDNVEAWENLGRIYFVNGAYENAAAAYEEAWRRTETPETNLKLAYAESSLLAQRDTVTGLAGQLIEQVLAEDPENSRALLYGAMAAETKGDATLARDRWQRLLAQNPPEQIAAIVRERLSAIDSLSGAQGTDAVAPEPSR